MVAQLVLERVGEQRRVAHHDDRVHRLDPALVGHAEDRDLEHRGVRSEGILDLERVHVLAAGDDHVLGSIEQVEVVLVVDVADVTRAVPAVDERRLGRLRVLPVADHHVRPSDDDLAGDARRARVAVGVDDAHLDTHDLLADRPEPSAFEVPLLVRHAVTIDEVSVAP